MRYTWHQKFKSFVRLCLIFILFLGKAVHEAVGRIALVMCLACASAGFVQVIVCSAVQIYKRDENFNVNEIANVILGALVAVTGCCPFIHPPFAILIGGNYIG
jgi:ammonia channel protein AmtB